MFSTPFASNAHLTWLSRTGIAKKHRGDSFLDDYDFMIDEGPTSDDIAASKPAVERLSPPPPPPPPVRHPLQDAMLDDKDKIFANIVSFVYSTSQLSKLCRVSKKFKVSISFRAFSM